MDSKRKCFKCFGVNVSQYDGSFSVWDPKRKVFLIVWHCNTCGNTWDKVKGKTIGT